MSRKSAAGALAVALTAGAASVASAGDDDHDRRTIRLVAKGTGVTLVENGQPGVGLGDRFVARGDLLRGEEKVGVAGVDCVTLTYGPGGSSYQCTATASLPDGQLAFQSLTVADGPIPSSATAAVTGGTGRYRTAHGEVTMSISTQGVQGEIVIRLR
jgi:hypothetical protein